MIFGGISVMLQGTLLNLYELERVFQLFFKDSSSDTYFSVPLHRLKNFSYKLYSLSAVIIFQQYKTLTSSYRKLITVKLRYAMQMKF